MPQDLIIGARTGGSSNLLRVNNASRRFSFRDVDGSWKEAANTDFAIFEKPDEVSRFLILELSANADYNPAATMNSQTDQTNFIYYDGAAWSAFPASGIDPTALGTLVAFNFAAVAKNLGSQIFFRFWWSDGQTTTEKKASIFPALSLTNSGASSAVEVEAATDSVAGIARAATQTEVDDGTAGFIFVTPATLNAKKFAASKVTGLAAVATSGDYNDLSNKYELPAASASARGGVKIGSNINLTNGDTISVASASASAAGVIQLASSVEVTAGTDNSKAVTPAGLKVELDKKANSADLKAVALSGSYNDLTDKPEIPEVVAASTITAGIVRLATVEEATGELATVAITPAGLNSALSGYYTSTEIDNKLSVVLRYKGVKATEAELPSSENETGDFWLVSEDSSEYVWNGTAWEKFGATISLDGYLTVEAAAQTYVAKTQLATSTSAGIVQIGQNINIDSGVISVKTASAITAGVVQLASTAEVTAGVNNFKAVTPAGLKFELDKKVNSADLAAVATSGDYNDLSNKYELPAATSTTIGGVKPGGNLTVTTDGTLNFTGFGAQSSDGSSLSSEIKVLKAGSGTQFSYNSGVLTIGLDSSVTGGLTAVSHDSTLTGQGTSADPLKVNAVTSVAVEANASDDKIPTELAVRKAVDAQKVTKLVLQRGVSDKALYPKIAFSASADFSSASEFDFSSNDFARSSARVFNGTGWITFPADGLGTPFDNKEVVIDVATLLGDAMPQLPFYFKFCWVEANGTASDYKSSVFPAAPSFPPAADVVDEERLLPTGGARGNVLKIDSTGKATWAEGIDEARLVPTGGGAGKVLGFQDGADRGNSDNVRLLLQNTLTDSATGNASPATVTAQGVTLTAENNLEFSGNDSHVTAVLPVAEIFAADKEWTIDFWLNPVANSSRWNYVLTETNGDWGSHSLGLTWNSTDQTLEQDSGGYVASTIKATNWPNASTPCASNQWHFVAVEKQKTESGWNLNYYLNGSPWLQVAFTSDFAPFDSTTPFWFGGNTSDGGRWFKGKANKLRVTSGARYGGKAFAVPDRSVDYEAPSGLPVWIDQVIPEPVDESRLLPENPANGDIPCYSNEPPVGVNYNDANTVLLLQGSSDNTAAAPTSERLNGIVTGEFPVQEDGSILVNGTSNYITFNDADTRRVFSGEFTLETYIKTTQFTASGKRQDTNWCVVYRNDTSSVTAYQWLLLSDFFADAGKFGIWPYPQMSGETFPKTLVNAEFQHVAIDVYMVDGVRKFTMYRNGVPYHTGNYWSTTPADWSSTVSAAMRLFGEGTSGGDDYLSNASVMSLRVSNIARYKGVSFDPPADGKYLNPPVGYWGKLNKNEIVKTDSNRLLPEGVTDGDIPCFDATATVGGGNDANTRLLLQPSTSDHGIVDQAAGNAAPVTLENHNVTVDEEGNMVFDGSNAYLKIPANTLPSDFFNGTDEWTLDIVYNVASKSRQCLFGRGDSPRMDFLLDSDGTLQIGGGPNLGTGWPFNEDVHLTFEIYKDGASWKYTIFRNGSVVTTGTWVNANWRSVDQYIGWEGYTDSRKINGKIKALRLTSGALHKGAAFQPDYPWTKPQTVGEWGKLNKSELVQSVNGVTPDESGNVVLDASTIIDNSRLLPVLDTLPEGYEGSLLAVKRGDGKVADENTLRLMHFNDDVRDVVTDETGTLKGNASITPTGYFAGALSINHAVVSSLSFNGLTATPTAWTMDFRVKLGRFSSNAPQVLIGTNLNETQTSLIRVDSSYIDIQATYNQRVIYKTHSLQLDTWYHFALTYDGTTYKFYIDGELFGSGESTNQFDFTRKLWFGSFYDYSTSYVSDCTIDEFRLSNVVRWTENFTPPDAPYGESLYNWGIGPKLDESRLLPETGSVSSDSVGNPVIFKAISRIDNTYWLCLPLNEDTNDRSTYGVATEIYGTVNVVSNAPSSPGGSAFFNGSSCLHGTLPAQFGTSDFTVRFWMMAPEMNSSTFPQTIFSTRRGNETSGSTFGLHCQPDGNLSIYSNTDITPRDTAPFKLQAGVWYHVAVVRKSGVATIYVDGKVYASGSFTNSLTRQIFGLGASWTGSSYSEAGTFYLTSLDVLNYAAYDGAFTTPAYQPGILAGMGYKVATDSEVIDILSSAGIDESRLLPVLDSVPVDRSGNPLVFKAIAEGIDANTLLYCPFDSDFNDHSAAGGQFTQTGRKSESITTDDKKFGAGGLSCGNNYNTYLSGPLAGPVGAADCTIHFWAKFNELNGRGPFALLTTAISKEVNFWDAALGCIALSVYSDSIRLQKYTSGNGNVSTILDASVALSTGVWHHFAVVRSGSTWHLFVDGELIGTGVNDTVVSSSFIRIGGDGEYTMNGLIDEFIVLDYAKWITDFEPPTQPATTLIKSYEVSDKAPVTADSPRLLPANPTNGDMAVYRKVPEDAAPQNLTSATSDSNWEVTWSGAYSGRVGWQAFDSDQLTTWCTYSAAVGDWLCWEYKGAGGKVLLRRYSIAKGSGNGDCPTGWKIQGSNDGSIWSDLDEQTGQSFPDNNAKEYTIPNNSTPYKFHRFYLLSWNTSNMIGTFKAWSWINSTDECNRWVTVDIADLQGTSENEITLVRPVSDQSLFPIIEASADVGFTSVQTINARTVAGDRTKIKVFNGSAFADFPDSGLGTPYDEQSVVIDVSGFIVVLGDSFYVRYKWESSDGTASDYKAAKFPLSVAQTPVSSTGGGSGNVSYQTFAIPAQSSWTLDPEDSTRQYVSVASGRCSCIVYDESGTEVGIEVRYVSSANETRLVIPADLAGGTITADWTCRYAQISEN